jgi:P27 family predicted phage terminase small subunit
MGTLQRCRTNLNEPRPDPGIPATPEHLSGRARKVFPQVAEMLFDMGVLTTADAMAVEGLCQAYADWRDAVEFVDRHGSTYVVTRYGPDGTPREELKAYPQVALRNEADRRMRGWLQSCGLTPVDRARVSALDTSIENPWGDLLG